MVQIEKYLDGCFSYIVSNCSGGIWFSIIALEKSDSKRAVSIFVVLSGGARNDVYVWKKFMACYLNRHVTLLLLLQRYVMRDNHNGYPL